MTMVNYPYPDDDPERLVEPSAFSPPRPQFYIRMASPFWTRVLLGCNLAVFIAMIVYGWVVYGEATGPEDGRVLVAFGMKVNELIAQGEIWRLFTAMFLHIGLVPIPLHLLSNLYALNALGPMVEGYYGHVRFLAIYLIGGLFGSVASYAYSDSPSAGASGAIFALIGATTVYFLRYRDNFGTRGRAIVQNMLVVIAINLFIGLNSSFIDNWVHIGGLVGGAVMAWALLPRYRTPSVVRLGSQPIEEEPKDAQEIAWVVIAVVVLWFAVQAKTNGWLLGF
jgi:rhomboid protease GluP